MSAVCPQFVRRLSVVCPSCVRRFNPYNEYFLLYNDFTLKIDNQEPLTCKGSKFVFEIKILDLNGNIKFCFSKLKILTNLGLKFVFEIKILDLDGNIKFPTRFRVFAR